MASFGDAFRLTLLTNDPALAATADRAGVDRIGLDLERLGKAERQTGLNTRLSEHRIEELTAIGEVVENAELFVRVNPINPGSEAEIETVLRHGADVIMLPYFRAAAEVATFVRLVGGRASTMILVETASALVRIRDILAVPGIDEVMAGLNDLRLDLAVHNHFEVLVSPPIEALAHEVLKANLRFSAGGVGRPDDASLPIHPDLVIAQYPRLGATGAWIARSFFQNLPPNQDFAAAVASLRRRLDEWAAAPSEALERARRELAVRAGEMAAAAPPRVPTR
jgi:hypothetical protein